MADEGKSSNPLPASQVSYWLDSSWKPRMSVEYKTPDKALEQYIATMGSDLGPVCHRLWNEVAWLHVKWDQYVQLFGSRPERIDLLNGAAATFFRIVQDTLWEDTLLHLARLTDSADTGGKPNLTIKRLAVLVEDALRDDVTGLVETAADKTAFARDWRNRHIAHRDLRLALQDRAEPLEPGSRADVKEALAAVAAVLRRICQHYENKDIIFEYIGDAADAEALLYVIRDGLEADARRRKRQSEGKIEPEDFTHRPI